MEPMQPRGVAGPSGTKTQLQVTAATKQQRIPSIAQASLVNLKTEGAPLKKNVSKQSSPQIPFNTFRSLSSAQMAENPDILKKLSSEELRSLEADKLQDIVGLLSREQFNKVALKISDDLDYSKLKQFPLEYLLGLVTSVRPDDLKVKQEIISTLLEYVGKYKNLTLDKDGMDIIYEMIKGEVFWEMNREEAKQLPRSLWEAIARAMPLVKDKKPISHCFRGALSEMPLDLLEKVIFTYNLAEEEKFPIDLLEIAQKIQELDLTPESAKPYHNIIKTLQMAFSKFYQQDFLKELTPPAELPPLSSNILQTLDAYLNNGNISSEEIEAKLPPEWLSHLAHLNIQMTSTLRERHLDQILYHKGTTLDLFLKLTRFVHKAMTEEGMSDKLPKTGRFLWEVANVQRNLEQLKPHLSEKDQSFRIFVNTIFLKFSLSTPATIRIPTSREKWLFLKQSGALSQVKQLILDRVNVLPPEIGDLENLEHLFLRKAQMNTFPVELKNLKKLAWFTIEGTPLKTIPKIIFEMHQLKTLELVDCDLKDIDPRIGNLIGLTALHLNGNKIEFLPDTIGKLKNLQGLYLNGNNLRALPETIGNLKQLKTLWVHYNKLTKLPGTLGNLSSLVSLIVAYNQINQVGKYLAELTKLEYLDLSGNLLAHLPDMGSLGKLVNLYLSDNRFQTISSNLPSSLLTLELDHNALKVIPSRILMISSLVRLKLEHNAISRLPVEMKNLIKLRGLHIAHNQLSNIPGPLPPNLSILDIRHNLFTEMPRQVLSHPQPLDLQIEGNYIPSLKLPPNSTIRLVGNNSQISKQKLL